MSGTGIGRRGESVRAGPSAHLCAPAGSLIVATNTFERVRSLQDTGSLVLANGSMLVITDRTPPSTVADPTLQGVLAGDGEVDITRSLDWLGHGVMLGCGVTVLERTAISTLSFPTGSLGSSTSAHSAPSSLASNQLDRVPERGDAVRERPTGATGYPAAQIRAASSLHAAGAEIASSPIPSARLVGVNRPRW